MYQGFTMFVIGWWSLVLSCTLAIRAGIAYQEGEITGDGLTVFIVVAVVLFVIGHILFQKSLEG